LSAVPNASALSLDRLGRNLSRPKGLPHAFN